MELNAAVDATDATRCAGRCGRDIRAGGNGWFRSKRKVPLEVTGRNHSTNGLVYVSLFLCRDCFESSVTERRIRPTDFHQIEAPGQPFHKGRHGR